MRSLSLLYLCAALPGVLWAAHTTLLVEGDNDASRICKPAPHWEIRGRAPMNEVLGNVVVVALLKANLRDRLDRSNMTEVAFMIVNEREAHSRAMYWELKKRAPSDVPVYQQAIFQKDVWEVLDGDKDDFLVYDRCGLLTFHIVLPYSYLSQPYVEAAIRATYQKNICNCSVSSHTSLQSVNQTTTSSTIQPDTKEVEIAPGTHSHIHNLHQHRHHHHDTSHREESEPHPDTTRKSPPASHHEHHTYPQHHHH
uniref:Selenoprotein P N-terminal domain-containing protein n=1 Tax=Anabas testudineus TaxID=64144 RepID=A0A3Q1HV68_ANATE